MHTRGSWEGGLGGRGRKQGHETPHKAMQTYYYTRRFSISPDATKKNPKKSICHPTYWPRGPKRASPTKKEERKIIKAKRSRPGLSTWVRGYDMSSLLCMYIPALTAAPRASVRLPCTTCTPEMQHVRTYVCNFALEWGGVGGRKYLRSTYMVARDARDRGTGRCR